jgi:Na+-translocating ferredoxin:NAD+ oxidoreductase subunit G
MVNVREIFTITTSLLITFASTGGSLAIVHAFTQPRIAEYERAQQAAFDSLLRAACPAVTTFEKAGVWRIHDQDVPWFKGLRKGKAVVYCINSVGKGYSSLINVVIVADTTCKVQKVIVTGCEETPGLGDQVADTAFTKQFSGRTIDRLVISADGANEGIEAVTGATISSKAVAEDAVWSAIVFLKGSLKAGK